MLKSSPFFFGVIKFLQVSAGDVVAGVAPEGSELESDLSVGADNTCAFVKGTAGHESPPVCDTTRV